MGKPLSNPHLLPLCLLPPPGDFWDERGALPVHPLNTIIRELQSWTQPTLMLVGNHDQVGGWAPDAGPTG